MRNANDRWQGFGYRLTLVLILYCLIGLGPGDSFAQAVFASAVLQIEESEPNDEFSIATVFSFPEDIEGDFGAERDVDVYMFEITGGQSEQLWTVGMRPSTGEDDVQLCLLDAAGESLQCREGTNPILSDLGLDSGIYGLLTLNRNRNVSSYSIQIDNTASRSDGAEAEPNEEFTQASLVPDGGRIQGRAVGKDDDFYQFEVSGTPQLWRIQVVGAGLDRIDYYDNSRSPVLSRSSHDGSLLRIENLFLLPGSHYVRVRATDGEYELSVEPLGEPVDSPLGDTAIAAFLAENDGSNGPVPIPVTEREPNDDESRAHRLSFDQPQSGRLSELDDRDAYRFFLGAEGYVRIHLVPGGDATVHLDLKNYYSNATSGPGLPFEQDLWLPPGDHFIVLDSPAPGLLPYSLSVSLLNPFETSVDLEPHSNYQAQAREMPPDLTVRSTVDRSSDIEDWFRLPPVAQPSQITMTLASADAALVLYDGSARIPLQLNRDVSQYTGVAPASEALDLRIRGDAPYTLTVVLENVDPEPTPELLPIEVSLSVPAIPLAGFWQTAQAASVAIELRNTGDSPQSVQLQTMTSDTRVTFAVEPDAISLAPGESATLDGDILILADLPAEDDVHVYLSVQDGAGAQVTAEETLAAVCGVVPTRPTFAWTSAQELLSGLNVAWGALGAESTMPDARMAELLDGIAAPARGLRGAPGDLITVDLAGTVPVPIVGILLNPYGRVERQDYLRDFELLVSEDGTDFRTVLVGELSAAAHEQAFLLAEPTQARFAQLRLISSHGLQNSKTIGLGLFKVIATPGAHGLAPNGFNLADPDHGGHVVYSRPLLGAAQELVGEELKRRTVRVDPVDHIEWVIGFHHNRAAQISVVEWQFAPEGVPAERPGEVEVQVSVDSPTGPWTTLGVWVQDVANSSSQRFELEGPTWARYVRFVAPGGEERATYEYPAHIRIWERPEDDSYRTILAEYGENRQQAIFELLQRDASSLPIAIDEKGENDGAADASLLEIGSAASGSVQIGVDEDWYQIDVTETAGELRLRLRGAPTVDVGYQLFDAAMSPISVTVQGPPTQLMLAASVEPGTYYFRLHEPPRSVGFVWDNSGSVSPYTPAIYQSLSGFATEINAEREVVNLRPFAEPGAFLLDEWSGDATAVQVAINNYDRSDSSSNAIFNLLATTESIGERIGTRAILLMTDAETGGFQRSADLWTALEEVRPRIFSFEISTAGNPKAQDLMQDWADVNAGVYDQMSSIGEFETGFARAACLLRRPLLYTLAAELVEVVAPTATPTLTPTITPTETPTPVPTATTLPTTTPSGTPSMTPTATPSPVPTATPTASPTATLEPTSTPTLVPTDTPTLIPSETATLAPTETPTPVPLPTLTPTPTPPGIGSVAVIATGDGGQVVGDDTAIELILDASGSMLQLLEGERRIDIAKAVLTELVQNVLTPDVPVALRVFGHIEPDACRTDLEVPLQPLDQAAMAALIAGIEAQNLARTPIADSLLLVASDLKDATGQNVVVLVTDGEETCDGNPAGAISALKLAGVDVRINIVGFAIADQALKNQFEAWAELGGGFYFDATSAADLNQAVQQALSIPYRVLDNTGAIVGTGIVNGVGIDIPAGVYTVEVLTAPIQTFENITVPGNQQVLIKVGGGQ